MIRQFIVNQLKRTPLYAPLVRVRANRRANQARKAMHYANLYPESLDAISRDYAYSVLWTDRRYPQILNIEECIRHVVSKKLKGAFVETGVFMGGASAFALKSMLRNEPGEYRPYWGFDSFEGMPQPTAKDGDHSSFWMFGKSMNEVEKDKLGGKLVPSSVNLSDYDKTLAYLYGTLYPGKQINLVKGWFQNTLPPNKSKIGEIAILRIDADFYESTKCVLEELYDQVVKGGFVIIDDYGSFEGCKKAVDEFLSNRRIEPYLHYVEGGVRVWVKE